MRRVTSKNRIRQKCRGPCERTRRIHHFRRAIGRGTTRYPTKPWYPICTECEQAGFVWCSWKAHAVPKDWFYPGKDGQPTGYCRDCEADRRITSKAPSHQTRLEAAEAKRAKGQRPKHRTTESDRRRIIKIYTETGNKNEVARRTGFHRNTIGNVLKANADKVAELGLAPDPIAYEDLRPEARRALDDPMYLASHYLRIELDPWANEVMHELLAAYYSDQDEWIVLNVAFGAGKSTVLTFVFVIWVILLERAKGHEPTILLGHKAESKAKWYLSRIAEEFTVRNPMLLEHFGRLKPENKGRTTWSASQLLVEPLRWEILREKEPTLAIGSLDGSTMSGHFGICVWDDLVDLENQRTVGQREKVVDHMDTVAESRPKAGGLFVLCGARIGPQDIYWNRLQQRYEDDLMVDGRPKPVWRRLVYKAHYPEKCDGEHRGPWPDGCLLSPRFVPWGRIRKAMLREDRFKLSYQQEDSDIAGSLADPVWFEGGPDQNGWIAPGCFQRDLHFGQRRVDGEGRTLQPILSAVSVDPSGSRFWAAGHYLVYADGRRQIYRAKRIPLQAPDLIYREQDGRYTGLLPDWYDQALVGGVPFTYVIVEARAQQKWLTQYEFVQTWAQKRGIVLIPHDTNRVNKHDPDRGVEMTKYIYRDARIMLPYAGPEERFIADTWKSEATAWPEGDTTDLVMQHWFLEHQLPHLLAVEEDREDKGDVVDRPAWADVHIPAWAEATA